MKTILIVLVLTTIAACSDGASIKEKIDKEAIEIRLVKSEEFSKCAGEQIQIARQNWDFIGSMEDDAYWIQEFEEQDQLRDAITEYCFEEIL